MMNQENPRAIIGHNRPPSAYELISAHIDDLYDTAKDFADGMPISSQEMHDEIERLHDMLHEAGRVAESKRVEEKEPLDVQIKEIQDRYNTLIGNTKSVKGKVVLGKETLAALLLPWRKRVADAKAEEARLAREEADRIAAEAQAAIRASSGNLAEREKAEELLAHAKQVDRFAKRQDKAATTGTGLRTVWRATLEDDGAALDWAYGRDPARFTMLVQSMADEAVRLGLRTVPGFRVWDDKVAS